MKTPKQIKAEILNCTEEINFLKKEAERGYINYDIKIGQVEVKSLALQWTLKPAK
jgi:hypothetical protein